MLYKYCTLVCFVNGPTKTAAQNKSISAIKITTMKNTGVDVTTCYHNIDTFHCQQDEWDTKEDSGKSMKNALYILQYAKRHLLGQSIVKQWKDKPVAIIKLCWSKGIGQLVSQ